MEEVLEVNNLPVKKGKRRTKLMIFLIIVILLIAGTIIGWLKYQQNQKEEYATILAQTSVDMYMEFVFSSVVVASYSDVWRKAIDNQKDFNTVLATFRDNLSNEGTLDEREKAQDKIRENMKLLQNPPKEYTDSYIVLKQMYGNYSKMLEQSLSPTGSLIDFNRKTNELYSQFEQQQEELLITLPADVKKLKAKYEKDKKKENK